MDTLITANQVFYLGTILFSINLWRLSFIARKSNVFINNMFIIYCFLVPVYTFFALDYGIAHYDWTNSIGPWVGMLGWSVINTLFIATDSMLLNYIIKRYYK